MTHSFRLHLQFNHLKMEAIQTLDQSDTRLTVLK